jgi:hypothetical protein
LHSSKKISQKFRKLSRTHLPSFHRIFYREADFEPLPGLLIRQTEYLMSIFCNPTRHKWDPIPLNPESIYHWWVLAIL